jgi:hypothetical protein
MDNFKIDVTCEGETAMRHVISIALTQHKEVKAYAITEKHGLVLYWTEADGATNLPYSFDTEATVGLVMGWLKERKDSEYRDYCDHDGHNGKGWRVYNDEDLGWKALLAVTPNWAWYGK